MSNLAQKNCFNKIPKLIETELGTEKLCIHCNEYWPLDNEFWFSRKNKSVKNPDGIRYEAACKCCYDLRYRPSKRKSTYKIKSNHEGVAA